MSDLEKAIELNGRRHRGEMYGCVDCYQNRPCTDRLILDAARQFANLTSPETIEKAAKAVKPYVDVDPAIEPSDWHLAQMYNARIAAAAVLRAVGGSDV